MSDLTAERLPLLESQRIPGLDLGNDVIHPFYTGNSILNVPSTVSTLLGAPPIGAPALDPVLLERLGGAVRHVVLVLMDALALHRLQRWMAEGSVPVWKRLVEQGFLAPLTSITPSTTAAALTSLWTGRAPTEHGVMGYEMWMKEYGVIANMILHSPASLQGSIGSLEKAGFKPKEYLPFPTVGAHLLAHGIEAHAFQHYTIAYSGLSQMFMRDVKIHAVGSTAELWVNLRKLLEERQSQRTYNWVYWGQVDHLSHHYGPDSDQAKAEFISFSNDFEAYLFDTLSLAVRQETVVILMADHGQINTTPDPFYELSSHASLERRLHMNPTGENRLMYLYARPGQSEAVREYIERTWMKQFRVLDSVYAAEQGLFGPGEKHPMLLERIGDLMVFPGGNTYLWWAPVENFLLGRHGGLHREEMLVPFLAARLG